MKERSTERSAACSVCGKTFARPDTLLRHEKNHRASEDRGPVHRVTNGTFRACQFCATARSRCSGGLPCGRCSQRNLECIYPNKKRKGDLKFDIITTKLNEPRHGPEVASQYTDISFASNNPHGRPSSQTSAMGTTSHTMPRSAGQVIQLDSLDEQANYQARDVYAGDNNALLSGSMQSLTQLMPTPTTGSQNYNIPADHYAQGFTEPGYDYTAFEDSLNWIPLSVFPSPFEGELEQDFSFMMPPLSAKSDTVVSQFSQPPSVEYIRSAGHTLEYDTQLDRETDGSIHANSVSGYHQSPAPSTSDTGVATKSINGSTGLSDLKKKRRKSSFPPDFSKIPSERPTGFSFSHATDFDHAISMTQRKQYCSERSYQYILSAFDRLCTNKFLKRPFETSKFPTLQQVNEFVGLYFENFHQTMPLLHKPSFGTEDPWLLILSTAGIGSMFTGTEHSVQIGEAFQEFLRRAINEAGDGLANPDIEVCLAQSRILNLIGLSQCDSEHLRNLVPQHQAELSRWCLESGILQLPPDPFMNAAAEFLYYASQEDWGQWRRRESLRRTGYTAWLLDTSLGYMANARPLCNMDDARTPLPCDEALWEADTFEQWQDEMRLQKDSPSLCAALEDLYAKKTVNSHLSELSQILLINALFQRTWEVGTHIKQPLSEWVPTGKARGFLNTPTKDNFWLPLYPLYANWRNSACDCLDVIQWQASAKVAKASGVEHGLMLHLHLARIVLLTPFQEIQDLLFSLIDKVDDSCKASFYVHDGSYQPQNKAKLPQIRKITWRWLREDQHKARLAMVHAGSVFWHVRRYSSSSFYEPLAVYLASIVLWTYASYKSAALERDVQSTGSKPIGGPSGPDSDLSIVQPARVERHVDHGDAGRRSSSLTNDIHEDGAERSESESVSSADQPEFIHLDRPCDDEIVQHFVRNGHNMSGHMSNVGDICKSPHKVLQEGAKLLRTRLSCWGVSREYYDILTKLAALRKGN